MWVGLPFNNSPGGVQATDSTALKSRHYGRECWKASQISEFLKNKFNSILRIQNDNKSSEFYAVVACHSLADKKYVNRWLSAKRKNRD